MNQPSRVLVVEDDDDAREYVARVLASMDHIEVTAVASAAAALEVLRRPDAGAWGLLITDLRLPGWTGLQLIEAARTDMPGLPCLVMTAHASVDAAVDAMRTGAVDFLTKPLGRSTLREAVTRAIASGPQPQRILAIGAHPDDVEIGVGGTLAQHQRHGDHVTILTLSRGKQGGDELHRAAEAEAAARTLGARLVLGDLEDTSIPEAGRTVQLIESIIAELQPDIVYVHSSHDVHQDHRAVHAATRIAARGVPSIYCYQSPSATVDFRPTRFIPIEADLAPKLDAIAQFASQVAIRDYLAPDLLVATARYWGRYAATAYAEPLEVLRDTPTPTTSAVLSPQFVGRMPSLTQDEELRYASA